MFACGSVSNVKVECLGLLKVTSHDVLFELGHADTHTHLLLVTLDFATLKWSISSSNGLQNRSVLNMFYKDMQP